MGRVPHFITVLLVLIVFSAASAEAGTTLTVSAAASLKDALGEIQKLYGQREPGVRLQFNFGSSGMLQKQIEEGAPVDLFISAGEKQMDALEQKRLLVAGSRSDLLGNELVLIVAREKIGKLRGFSDLTTQRVSLSIAQPETVPSGAYARETLTALKLWDKVKDRIIFANDVRQVATYVDSGNVDAGIVYRSDTIALKSAVQVAVAAKESHRPIVYPLAVIKGRNSAEALKFAGFLLGPAASKVFDRYRFIPLKYRPQP
jgi:molybdate transport system substrate-binding protein